MTIAPSQKVEGQLPPCFRCPCLGIIPKSTWILSSDCCGYTVVSFDVAPQNHLISCKDYFPCFPIETESVWLTIIKRCWFIYICFIVEGTDSLAYSLPRRKFQSCSRTPTARGKTRRCYQGMF